MPAVNLLKQLVHQRRAFLAGIMILMMSGGHVALLQVTAWSSMLLQRAPDMGWQLAVNSTFDGSAPCSLCHAVDDLQTEQATSRTGAARTNSAANQATATGTIHDPYHLSW